MKRCGEVTETEREGEREGWGPRDRQRDRQAVVQKRTVGKGQKIGQYRQIPTHSPPVCWNVRGKTWGVGG